MPSHARVYDKDEELGKRDDDFRPRKHQMPSSMVPPWRWRRKRILILVAVIILFLVFLRNLPAGLETVGPSLGPGQNFSGLVNSQEPTGPPPRWTVQRDPDTSKHYYDGPIKYYRLAATLHSITRTMGAKQQNRNVLFAVSSLKSASNLIPMACEMAKWDRNYVHMTFFGRAPLPMAEILEINGVTKPECDVYFHDGRSDYSEYSTDNRAEVAVSGAMKHLNDFMHPQAIIMDDSTLEDTFFTRAMRTKAREFGRPLIEIPARQYEEFLWMTRLNADSLSNWFRPSIDILIHALPESSGGLIRLIESLKDAFYDGLRIPRLTIEVPSDLDPFARRYLANLIWPPGYYETPLEPSTLTLRHRISSSRISAEQASLRFLESFYPADVANDHVLVLSPQAEVSPLYLQYLHYAILEYHYSSVGTQGSEDMLGISLDLPSTFLNGTAEFKAPTLADMSDRKYNDESRYDQSTTPPFLYQAPSSTASLIFGDKWTTMHNFLSYRLAASHAGKAEKTVKLIPESEPAWLEYLLELMRARGWSMLQPPYAFTTIHNELAQIPEEYMRPQDAASKNAGEVKSKPHPEDEAFLLAAEPVTISEHIERDSDATQPLHEILLLDGDLPEFSHLPYVSHTGALADAGTVSLHKDAYWPHFRETIGGCQGEEATRKRLIRPESAADLFCLPGMLLEYDDEPEAEEEASAQVADMIAAASAGPDLPGAGEDGEEGVTEEAKSSKQDAVASIAASIAGTKGARVVETQAKKTEQQGLDGEKVAQEVKRWVL